MTSLHHIGYWVDDLADAMRRWDRDLGVGPFEVIEHVTFEEFALATAGGRPDHDRCSGRLRGARPLPAGIS